MTAGRSTRFTAQARLGEAGIAIVSRIVNRDLGWIFRRTHQEHDFGIDGYVDIVDASGSVSGRSFAVQVKCGLSYFAKKDEDGFVFRGDRKHLNYLLNHPSPVVLVLCNPRTEECFWAIFDPELTSPAGRGWRIAVPEDQRMAREAAGQLAEVAGPPHDYVPELEEYWRANSILDQEWGVVLYVVDRSDVESRDVEPAVSFFSQLLRTRAAARRNVSRAEISVHGYDDDPRELFEIPEVRAWFSAIEPRLSWFFLLKPGGPGSGLMLMFLCVSDVVRTGKNRVDFSGTALGAFFERQFALLNELTAQLGFSEAENEEISRRVVAYFGDRAATS